MTPSFSRIRIYIHPTCWSISSSACKYCYQKLLACRPGGPALMRPALPPKATTDTQRTNQAVSMAQLGLRGVLGGPCFCRHMATPAARAQPVKSTMRSQFLAAPMVSLRAAFCGVFG